MTSFIDSSCAVCRISLSFMKVIYFVIYWLVFNRTLSIYEWSLSSVLRTFLNLLVFLVKNGEFPFALSMVRGSQLEMSLTNSPFNQLGILHFSHNYLIFVLKKLGWFQNFFSYNGSWKMPFNGTFELFWFYRLKFVGLEPVVYLWSNYSLLNMGELIHQQILF